jgi:hypothetical protein
MPGAGTLAKGAAVIVQPPMTPQARHAGQIVRKSPNGWRVRFVAWGATFTETFPASALELANSGDTRP